MLSPGDCVCAGGMPNGPEPNVLLGVGAMMGLDSEGTQRTLSAYNLFVREMLRQFKEQTPDMPQVCRCRTARDRHRSLAPSAAARCAGGAALCAAPSQARGYLLHGRVPLAA